MKYHQRREFLREIEQLAKRSEADYRKKIGAMMFKARAWMAGVLIGALALVSAAMGAAYADWIPVWLACLVVVLGLGICWTMVRVMFFELEPPHGFDIARTASPLLFKDLRELRQKLAAPRFHDIVFTMEMGAAMVEVPRWSGLLPARNCLIIGLPLLHGVSRDEFLSILAHELAHLSRKHNRLTRSVYRLRVQLVRAHGELQRRVYGPRRNRTMAKMVDFWERFELATRRLAREHEFEADRIAGKLASTKQAAVALCKAHVLGRYWGANLDDEIARHMVRSSIPDLMPLQTFCKHLAGPSIGQQFGRMLEKELLRRTSPEDTHPALDSRLEALGERPTIEWVVPESAARAYFGRECEKISGAFDKAWLSWIIPHWRAKYDESRRARDYNSRLRGMEKRGEKLGVGELWSMAAIEERLLNLPSSAAGYERFLQHYPEALEGKLALGRVLLEEDAPRAEALLREVALAHPLLWVPARELLRGRLREQGRVAEVEALEESLDQTHGTGEEVFEERLEVRSSDSFKPAEQDRVIIDAIYNLAGQLGTVKKLWLLERKLNRFPEIRDFVLIFTPTKEAYAKNLVEPTRSILATEIYLPGTYLVATGNLRNWSLVRRAKKTEGAEIFAKDD